MRFYLAGPFVGFEHDGRAYNDWRDYVIEQLKEKHTFSDPRHNDQSCPASFTLQDIEGVLSSDGVLHYRTPRGEDTGSSLEHGIALGASRRGPAIPIILVDEHPFPFPLLSASAKRTFTRLPEAMLYLGLLSSWDKEFEAINAYIEQAKK